MPSERPRCRPKEALEPELPIIDPHHHVWDDERGRYLIHELAEDVGTGHNIIATVFIEAGSMYRADGPTEMKPVGEVEFVNGIAAMSVSGRYGKPRLCAGIIGHGDPMLGDKVQPVLEALIAAGNGRLRGRSSASEACEIGVSFVHGFCQRFVCTICNADVVSVGCNKHVFHRTGMAYRYR